MLDENYKCSLTEKSLQKAKEELNEDPDERLGAVYTLREWAEREPWINAPTGTQFLLAFLRCSKFSQLGARERLGNYLASYYSGSYSFMTGHDPGDPYSLEILKDGSTIILPERDDQGCVIIWARARAIDTSHPFIDHTRAYQPLFDSMLLFDENVQVNGIQFFLDCGDVTMNFVTWAGAEGFSKSAEFTNKSVPARIKSVNYYNTGPVLEALVAIFKPLLKEKIRNRIHIHPTMVSVYEKLDKSLLPKEYLPDDYKGPSAGEIKDIVEKNIQDYILDPARRAFLKDLYSGKYSADLTKRPSEPEAMASFRKLHVS